MGLKVLFGIFVIIGILVMWFSVFGKKNNIDDFSFGGSSNLVELIFDISFEFSPTLIKRILLFLLGLALALICTMGVFYA
ncbi:hypothetical protein AN960_10020 [Bacillus sp. FJAT-25509]|uniref:hypothetical protein n=1 Tax=Bacillus sp. FJAT-25509 TaxID=1712029 RepID=UPI0006F6A81D|nr:hypothetical protein [Bacillus sp. FJAT-25509]KQL39290.1 hypothetical protein AN960_10020 [Bacillus sp. FJAT-25509]